jgi:hypothetical protein
MSEETRAIIRRWLKNGKYLYSGLDEVYDPNFESCSIDHPDVNLKPLADAIEAAERERCAKVAETAYDATAEGREWGYCFAAKIRSES